MTPADRAVAIVFGASFEASLGPGMESVRKALWFMETRFSGEAPLDALSVVARISRCRFAHDATIKAWSTRIFELIREMLVVVRLRQLDDGEQRINTGVP
jgi:hypothetical protein